MERVGAFSLVEKDISFNIHPFCFPLVIMRESDIGLGVVVACLPSFLP